MRPRSVGMLRTESVRVSLLIGVRCLFLEGGGTVATRIPDLVRPCSVGLLRTESVRVSLLVRWRRRFLVGGRTVATRIPDLVRPRSVGRIRTRSIEVSLLVRVVTIRLFLVASNRGLEHHPPDEKEMFTLRMEARKQWQSSDLYQQRSHCIGRHSTCWFVPLILQYVTERRLHKSIGRP